MKKTVFVSSLPLILALSNVIGMGHFCYRVQHVDESTVTKSNSGTLAFLELLRTTTFFFATYTTLRLPSFYLRYLQLIRFGAGVVLAQLLENRMVKYGCLDTSCRAEEVAFSRNLLNGMGGFVGWWRGIEFFSYVYTFFTRKMSRLYRQIV